MPAETATTKADERDARRVSAALGRYRVIAYIVGIGLLALTVATILDWGFGISQYAEVIGPLHGFLYMIYVLLAADLWFKTRWSLLGGVLVVLAGTIPFLSFVAEHQVTKRVRAGRSL